jgi:hypothetical protein
LEVDPSLYENDEQKYEILKKNDGLRLEILTDLLSTHLGIVVRKHQDLQQEYTNAYFLGRHELKFELIEQLKSKLDSENCLKNVNLSMKFCGKNVEIQLFNKLKNINIIFNFRMKLWIRFMAYVLKTVNELSETYLQNERRYNYTTPKSYLELIFLFKSLLIQKDAELKYNIRRLEDGLIEIAVCDEKSVALQEDLKVSHEILKEKNESADKWIEVVNLRGMEVQKERDRVNEEEKAVRVIEKMWLEKIKFVKKI